MTSDTSFPEGVSQWFTDYIYRFDPKNPIAKPLPPDAEAARRILEDGNRLFSQWMESCRTRTLMQGDPQYVVPCNGLEMGMPRKYMEDF